MLRFSRMLAAGLLLSTLALAACGSDDDPAAPVVLPPLGVTATPTSVSSIRITFNSVSGDTGYDIERAEGATGTFAAATTVAAPATAGALTWDDTNLKVNTAYRYRVTAVRGTSRSQASSEATATTFAFGGNQTIDVTTDITANMSQVASAAREASTGASETLKVSSEVSRMANDLMAAVGQFRL